MMPLPLPAELPIWGPLLRWNLDVPVSLKLVLLAGALFVVGVFSVSRKWTKFKTTLVVLVCYGVAGAVHVTPPLTGVAFTSGGYLLKDSRFSRTVSMTCLVPLFEESGVFASQIIVASDPNVKFDFPATVSFVPFPFCIGTRFGFNDVYCLNNPFTNGYQEWTVANDRKQVVEAVFQDNISQLRERIKEWRGKGPIDELVLYEMGKFDSSKLAPNSYSEYSHELSKMFMEPEIRSMIKKATTVALLK